MSDAVTSLPLRRPRHSLQVPPAATWYILLVEDSADDALLIERELAKTGRDIRYRRVDSAATMEAALTQQRWDLVISDHRMPGFNAIEACRLLRRVDSETPFVILSGAIAEATAIKALRMGAHDCIDKGNLARLVPVVQRELRTASLRRAKEHIEESLVHLTYHSPLTGLPNRELLQRLVEHSLAARPDPGDGAALFYIDLDRLMRVNESLGTEGGDLLLREVGMRLSTAFADAALVAHLGQDKFAVFIEGRVDDATARLLASAINEALAPPFRLDGEEIHMTCGIGVCCYPEGARDVPELMRNAEAAMVEAKRMGPGMVRLYGVNARPRYDNRLRLENALRHAVERRELFLEYQPCIDTLACRINGAEALVRWRHPKFGIMPPDAFIPLADETGLVVDVGHWVLTEACRQSRLWHEAGHRGLIVAVNVSAVQFRRSDFAERVAGIIVASGVDPSCLELEITETAAMHDAEANVLVLRRLKAMGVRIAIDDFGTGYSSLSYLKRLPIDTLKIDRTFLLNLDEDGDNQAIVRTIVALGKTLKLSVVAEGVEKLEQLQFLRALGCDRAQGFLIGRPQSSGQLTPALAAAPVLNTPVGGGAAGPLRHLAA